MGLGFRDPRVWVSRFGAEGLGMTSEPGVFIGITQTNRFEGG